MKTRECPDNKMSPDCPVHHIFRKSDFPEKKDTRGDKKKGIKTHKQTPKKKIFKNTHKREYTILLLRLIWCTMIIEKPKYINYKFSLCHLCKKLYYLQIIST